MQTTEFYITRELGLNLNRLSTFKIRKKYFLTNRLRLCISSMFILNTHSINYEAAMLDNSLDGIFFNMPFVLRSLLMSAWKQSPTKWSLFYSIAISQTSNYLFKFLQIQTNRIDKMSRCIRKAEVNKHTFSAKIQISQKFPVQTSETADA